jgi:hypothetical protein
MLRMMQERGDLGGTVSLEIPEPQVGSGVSADDSRRHTKTVFTEAGMRYSLDTDTGLTTRRQR